MAAPDANVLASVFGILGNIVSFMVYLAPLPTFYRIFNKKSTEGFQSVPYSVALFSAMSMLYYALLKGNALVLITINSIGIGIETTYLLIFMIYATSKARISTAKLLILFNLVAYGVILLGTYKIPNQSLRIKVVGWTNVVVSVCVFAAPLSIMRLVIRTRSVEFMSFSLSFCLTLCAVIWFCYGLLVRDLVIAAPNILGFAFGITQMIMYLVFKNSKKKPILPEFSVNDEVPNGVAPNDTQVKTEDTNKTSQVNGNQTAESMTGDQPREDDATSEPNESVV